MRNDERWDELADLVGTAYQELELFIATRDLRLAEATPAEREQIFEEGTMKVRAISDAVKALMEFDRSHIRRAV